MSIQAEKQLDVAESISFGAHHVAEEEVAEFDVVATRKEKAPDADQEPPS